MAGFNGQKGGMLRKLVDLIKRKAGEVEEPESTKEASDCLARHGESGVIYAGRTEMFLALSDDR